MGQVPLHQSHMCFLRPAARINAAQNPVLSEMACLFEFRELDAGFGITDRCDPRPNLHRPAVHCNTSSVSLRLCFCERKPSQSDLEADGLPLFDEPPSGLARLAILITFADAPGRLRKTQCFCPCRFRNPLTHTGEPFQHHVRYFRYLQVQGTQQPQEDPGRCAGWSPPAGIPRVHQPLPHPAPRGPLPLSDHHLTKHSRIVLAFMCSARRQTCSALCSAFSAVHCCNPASSTTPDQLL